MRLNTVQRAIVEALSEKCGYGIQNVEKALEDLIEGIAQDWVEDNYVPNVENRFEDEREDMKERYDRIIEGLNKRIEALENPDKTA